MSESVRVRLPRSIINEGSSFTATANFRTGTTAAAPTTVRYRIDCLTTGKNVIDWTSASAAAEVSIVVPPALMQDQSSSRERYQIIVEADAGLSTQVIGYANWLMDNLQGMT